MGVPLTQMLSVGAYITKERLRGNGRFPLVLMLEPLFRCNLSCSGCGKIDYPEEVLRRRLGVSECLDAARECGAPIVSIPGGEPLMHPEIGGIVEGLTEMKRFVYLCTNAVLLKKKLGLFRPSQYLTFSVHLDGFKELNDRVKGTDQFWNRPSACEGESILQATASQLSDGEPLTKHILSRPGSLYYRRSTAARSSSSTPTWTTRTARATSSSARSRRACS